MAKRKAFIAGIAGQDGSYLAELLLENDYAVYGIVRRNSTSKDQTHRVNYLDDKIRVEYGDLLDVNSLERMLETIKPDEVYNLAAQSHVRISFDMPQFTVQTNALGVLNILEAYKKHCFGARFYQASSSEMFGKSVEEDGHQRETTKMNPTSPYGCAKLFGYNIVRNYRFSYNLFAVNGILFNHESPRRSSNFITTKVISSAVRIKLGLQDKLELGNMDTYRDWGHSKDYVRAMHLIVNHSEPDDFVVATGKTRSVRDMCEYIFNMLGLNYKDYVVQNPKFLRPEELKYSKGDCTKIKQTLGWKPEYTFETMMNEMIRHWEKIYGV